MSMYPLEAGDTEAAFSAAMSVGRDRFNYHGSSDGDPVQVDSFEQPDVGGQVSVT